MQTGYPLKQEIHDVIDRPELVIAAHSPMKRVLDQILIYEGLDVKVVLGVTDVLL